MLKEWSLIDWEASEKANGFIKLYVEQRKNSLVLFLLTEQNHLELEDLIGYEINESLEHLKHLSISDAIKLYARLLDTSIKAIQEKLYREAC